MNWLYSSSAMPKKKQIVLNRQDLLLVNILLILTWGLLSFVVYYIY